MHCNRYGALFEHELVGGVSARHRNRLAVAAGVRCARWFSSERREVGVTPARPIDWAQHRSSQSFAGVSVCTCRRRAPRRGLQTTGRARRRARRPPDGAVRGRGGCCRCVCPEIGSRRPAMTSARSWDTSLTAPRERWRATRPRRRPSAAAPNAVQRARWTPRPRSSSGSDRGRPTGRVFVVLRRHKRRWVLSRPPRRRPPGPR